MPSVLGVSGGELLTFSATFRSEAEEKFKVNLKSVLSIKGSVTLRIRGQFSVQSRRLLKKLYLGRFEKYLQIPSFLVGLDLKPTQVGDLKSSQNS